MIRAACHCTAVRLELAETPNWVLDCSCTLCRRYGALWTYPNPETVTFVAGETATESYVWGDRMLGFHRCRTCGCLTHTTRLDTDPPLVYSINARMMPSLDPTRVTIRRKDNGHTGWFWSRQDAPVESSQHPPMPRPTASDWR